MGGEIADCYVLIVAGCTIGGTVGCAAGRRRLVLGFVHGWEKERRKGREWG